MSQENVEIVRRMVEANRSGTPAETVERAVALVDDDVEFTSRLASVEGATYRGQDGVRAYFEDMADAWEEWSNEVAGIGEIGPDILLADINVRATGRGGVDIETQSTAIFVFSQGKAVRIHSYASRQEALEAAGLQE